MKKLFLLLVILNVTNSALSQSKIKEEANAFFWGKNDKYKKVVDIPEKWNNESAVIIYKNENYDFHKFGKKITYKTSIRKRIKLLDNAAVTEFSEFSFKKRFRSTKGIFTFRSKGNNVVGVKIIKPNGKEIIIDIEKEAVEVDGETKVAIPNLEVGDILDYYFLKVEPFKSSLPFGFDPVETTLAEEYPIVDYKLFLESENDFFINFKSFNGAPELKEIKTEKRSLRNYTLEASNIDKLETERWFYPLIELPSYKFQVYFARTFISENKARAFLPEKEDVIKTSVSQEDVLEVYDNYFEEQGDIKDVKKYFKEVSPKSDVDKVIKGYYFMRHFYLTRYIEAIFAEETEIMSGALYYFENNPVFIKNDYQFINHFTAFLDKQEIDYEIILAKKRYDGKLEDLLFTNNLNYLIKTKTSTPLYISPFDLHTNINQIDPLIEGTEAYSLKEKRGKIESISKTTLPVTTHQDNVTTKEIDIVFNPENTKLDVKITKKIFGHFKKQEQSDLLVITSYTQEDYKKYGTETLIERVSNKKRKETLQKNMNALLEKIETRKIERLEKNIQSEYDLSEINNYKYNIKETGRFDFKAPFIYSEEFTIEKDLVKKAGNNYILEIGKLIGGQVDIDQDERIRNTNIYLNFAKTFNNQIKLQIPEGYTVSGLDKLSKSVNNKTGAFESSAKLENNILTITTKKEYKSNFTNSEDWNLMLAFLDEAFQFSNEKILIKKN